MVVVVPFTQLKVAVIISGMISSSNLHIASIQKHLVQTIAEAGHNVRTVMCSDKLPPDPPESFAVHLFNSSSQTCRLQECFNIAKRNESYDFYIRVRPDLIVFAPIALVPYTDAIQARMRVLPQSLGSILRRESSYRCKKGSPAVDDQFAIVPSALSNAYFNRAKYTHHGPYWPEYALTSKLASLNASIRITPFPVRLSHSRLHGAIDASDALARC